MKAFPIPVVSLDAVSALVGPGSQAAADEGFDWLPLPSGMGTFDPPPLPETANPAATAAAIAVLEDALADLRGWVFGTGTNPAYDLAPMPPDALAVINEALGQGEVSAIVRGTPGTPGEIHVQETVFAGLWRVQTLDADGRLAADVLEAGPIPAAVPTAAAAPQREAGHPLPPLIAGIMNAQPVVHELIAAAHAHRPGDPAHVVNLSLLPMTPADLAWLSAALGTGRAVILSRGYGNCRIAATALPATWRVQYFNNDDRLILDTVEVTAIPDVALAAAEDFADSLLRLDEWVATLRKGLADGAGDV
ncbi:hydrogenase expression/formation protein [Pseudothauera rhizosphaerae]|uniref:Hydrogenase expression/formation protein n=1 Tax=Pseudothauera rhizosphaerae TaxID=2565932 RepID=A0A4S4B348_9RHOO|nr:hydrogenase expression/formation protein [Pseudothauera rhizosphaerae]THF65331.1 hydrogenase expression/formation protein [Pseudothauera rhizosphaerae]